MYFCVVPHHLLLPELAVYIIFSSHGMFFLLVIYMSSLHIKDTYKDNISYEYLNVDHASPSFICLDFFFFKFQILLRVVVYW